MKQNTNNKSKSIRGTVISDSMDKTVVVDETRIKTHPLYHKQYSLNKRYKAHDEQNQYKIGDQVEITQSKPISKNKKYTVLNKI